MRAPEQIGDRVKTRQWTDPEKNPELEPALRCVHGPCHGWPPSRSSPIQAPQRPGRRFERHFRIDAVAPAVPRTQAGHYSKHCRRRLCARGSAPAEAPARLFVYARCRAQADLQLLRQRPDLLRKRLCTGVTVWRCHAISRSRPRVVAPPLRMSLPAPCPHRVPAPVAP